MESWEQSTMLADSTMDLEKSSILLPILILEMHPRKLSETPMESAISRSSSATLGKSLESLKKITFLSKQSKLTVQASKVELCPDIQSSGASLRSSPDHFILISKQLHLTFPQLPGDSHCVPVVRQQRPVASQNRRSRSSVIFEFQLGILDGHRGKISNTLIALGAIHQDAVFSGQGLEFHPDIEGPEHLPGSLERHVRLAIESWI